MIGMLLSIAILIIDRSDRSTGDDAYQQLRQRVEKKRETALIPDDTTAISGEQDQTSESEHVSDNPESDPLQNPDESPMQAIDFAYLASINADIAAWIVSDNGMIDYPVLQSTNNDYYLRRLFTRERNKIGSIFLDYRNDRDFSSKNSLIYGHNMEDGLMFASLTNYGEQHYYDDNPTMMLYTPEGNYRVELFAGFVVDGDYESIRMVFSDDTDFLSYIATVRESSDFTSDTAVTAQDRIITLCTCSYDYDNARYALFGKLTAVPS